MGDVDDVWASMKADASDALQVQNKRMSVNESKPRKNDLSVDDMIAQSEAKETKEKRKKQKALKEKEKRAAEKASSGSSKTKKEVLVIDGGEVGTVVVCSRDQALDSTAGVIEGKEMLTKIGRDLSSMSNMDDVKTRRKAMISLNRCLFVDHTMSDDDYSEVFSEICKSVFKRFADPVEKCRDVAYRIAWQFFEKSSDLTLVLGYFIPAFMARIPTGMAYDEEMKVFVMDMEAHEAYRRGKAVDRADKVGSGSHHVIEPSEEIRLLGCNTLKSLIVRLCGVGASAVLHPYFHEIVMYLQAQCRDPCPELKMCACEAFEVLCSYEDYNSGMKYFAVAICRQILPILRHRHAKVRVAAVSALGRCLSVPDRAKLKGSGTEAIVDLVGFKEENSLSVSSFYKADVSINYLAELVTDNSALVRTKVMELLNILLTEIGDKYDHETRLLPYLLDLLNDEAEVVASGAMACLQLCGKKYEEDHHDEIIERRQYGVDGDSRINLEKPFPAPFVTRPRLGVRLYVRGNCKRFLTALVNELTNWVSTTRLKSAQLLKMIVILMEEHMTMEAYTLIPAFIKALGFSIDDNDKDLYHTLIEVYELAGRYMLPEVYVHYVLPRLNGDPAVVQFGIDASTRATVLEFLGALLQGSQAKEVAPYFEEIVNTLTDPFVISHDSSKLMNAAMGVMNILLDTMVDRGKSAIEAHFLNTGRLTSLRVSVSKAFRWLTNSLGHSDLRKKASSCLISLAQLDRDSLVTDTSAESIKTLFSSHGSTLLCNIIDEFDCSSTEWLESQQEQSILKILVESPWCLVQCDGEILSKFLTFLIDCICGKRGSYEGSKKDEIKCYLSDLFSAVLLPVLCDEYFVPETRKSIYKHIYLSDKGSAVWPGLGKCSGAENAKKILDFVRSMTPVLAECFINHDRWTQSIILQTKRLQLLLLFLNIMPSDFDVASSSSDSLDDALVHSLKLSFSKGISGEAILDIAMELSSQATTVLVLRKLGVQAIERIFQHLKYALENETNQRSLKSYSKMESIFKTDTKMCEIHNNIKKQASKGIKGVVNMLNDSSDIVRLDALDSLLIAVPLILEEDFGDICDSLIKELQSLSFLRSYSKTEREFCQKSEDVLRSLSVLNPSVLAEKASNVIDLLEPLTDAQKSFKDELPVVHDVVRGIIDHCSVLEQFNK